jgi:hypothetical protein
MYPPPKPVVTNSNQLTVSMLLKNPKLITRRVSDMALRRDYLGVIFADNGLNDSGATAFQKLTANDLVANQKSEPIAPGAEYPKIDFSDPTLFMANIAKQGAEFDITYEMRDRDKMGQVDQNIQKLVNTITIDTQNLAMTVLNAAVAADSRTASGQSWSAMASVAASSATAAGSIYADLAAATMDPVDRELPYEYDTAIINPAQWRVLLTLAGKDGVGGVRAQFDGFGIKNIWVTNRQTAGKIKFVSAKNVGAREWEGQKGVTTDLRDEPGRDTFVVKGKERVMAYVTDPFAILELQGLS